MWTASVQAGEFVVSNVNLLCMGFSKMVNFITVKWQYLEVCGWYVLQLDKKKKNHEGKVAGKESLCQSLNFLI